MSLNQAIRNSFGRMELAVELEKVLAKFPPSEFLPKLLRSKDIRIKTLVYFKILELCYGKAREMSEQDAKMIRDICIGSLAVSSELIDLKPASDKKQ